MARIFTVLIMIGWLLLAPSAWAEATEDANDKKLKEIEGSYEKAVRPSEKILQEKLLQRKDFVGELIGQIKLLPDGVERQRLQGRLAVAIDDFNQDLSKMKEEGNPPNGGDSHFAGMGFGVAIGVVSKAGKRDVIQSATLDPNGIVRVDSDANTTANLILEGHYFFTPEKRFIPQAFDAAPRNWGHGPFIAVQPGTQNIIEAVGIGWMLGFKRANIVAKDTAPNRGDSFNLGLGIMVNPNAQVLGDGITKNQALPAGETAVRLKTTTEMGWLFVFSYTF